MVRSCHQRAGEGGGSAVSAFSSVILLVRAPRAPEKRAVLMNYVNDNSVTSPTQCSGVPCTCSSEAFLARHDDTLFRLSPTGRSEKKVGVHM